MLLDNCHAGAALDAAWRQRLGERRKTWVLAATVLAATRADEDAYQGRFSQAVAAVPRDLRSGGLGVDPSQEWASISLLARLVHQELWRRCRAGGALPQDLVADLVDPAREATPRFFRNPHYSPEARERFLMVREQDLRDYLDNFDAVLDPAHYLGRALGRIDHAGLAGGVLLQRPGARACLARSVAGRRRGPGAARRDRRPGGRQVRAARRARVCGPPAATGGCQDGP